MEFVASLLVLCILITTVQSRCFKLERAKNQFLMFETSDIEFVYSSDFQLSFKTDGDNGLLYYTEKDFIDMETSHDYEGLYIYNGTLNYFIFNPTKYGIGSSRGAHVKADFTINNGTWHTVEFFRNKEFTVDAPLSGNDPIKINRTGIILDGQEFVSDGTIQKLDVFNQKIFVGGHTKWERIDPSNKVGAFNGYVRNFKDLKTNKEMVAETPGSELFESLECEAEPIGP